MAKYLYLIFTLSFSLFFFSCSKDEPEINPETPPEETPVVPTPTVVFVSKDPSLKNLLIEEFTGRNCPNCPDGHLRVDNVISQNKDRVYSIRVHSESYYSPTTFPNLNTEEGKIIDASFNVTGYPSATFNRSLIKGSYLSTNRNDWATFSNEIIKETSYLNIAVEATIDTLTRKLSCEVQVYYTDNSPVKSNLLFLAMTQDSIIGSQEGRSLYLAKALPGGLYRQDHTLRSYISSVTGDSITTTTKQSFFKKEFTYQIPVSIKEVPVDLKQVHILAFVAESDKNIINVTTSKILLK